MPSTYTPIATYTVPSATANYTFSSIPSTYTDLVLVASVRNTTAGTSDDSLDLQFNGDTTTNYSMTRLYGNGTSAASARNTSITSLPAGRLNEGNTASGIYSANIIHIMNYANTTTFKTVLGRANTDTVVYSTVGLWRKTPEAITSILIKAGANNLGSGSTFTLYGIKAA